MVETHLDSLRSVRQLLAGGDVLAVSPVQKVLRELEGCTLINGYGPTENTTFTTCFPMKSGDEVRRSVSIGRPISNTQVYILDRHLQPVPIGVTGELFTGGDGVARGYLNRPELTTEKFITNPFSQDPEAWLYRTGDLARYLSDGNIEFLGRVDHQVKIRGFRIELGEIETVLRRYPTVRESLIMAREDTPGDKRLVAYLVPEQEVAPTVAELRRFLKERLPDYMVPSAFVFLDTLPLTLNGKVDRRALPAPDLSHLELDSAFVTPRTPIEEMLTGIWEEVLKVTGVGIHDNFFELGGHSLLATQVISRIRDTFQLELPLRSLFETPTVATLAVRFESARRTEPEMPLQSAPRDRDLPLSFAQQRLWFLDQLEPDSVVYNIPRAFHLNGPLNVTALEQSLNKIVHRHEVFRTSFSVQNGQPLQVIAPSLTLPLPVVDLYHLPEAKREAETQRLVVEEARRTFDLSKGPLFRASLLKLDEAEHILLLAMHHIVSDGWSMGILFQELAALYQAFSTGQSSSLPELPNQYADFALWQREWLQGEELERQLAYWKTQLEGLPPILELPIDRPRPAIQTFRGVSMDITLPPSFSKALKELSRREGVTLFMTLLAAFQVLLYRYTRQDDLVIGTPIANRNRSEIEDLIGFFANTLTLRTDLSGQPTFRELMARVRQVTLAAYEHQDLPFERLVEELQPERNLSHSPLFQVMFVLQNASKENLQIPGLTVNSLRVDSNIAKFDLSLIIIEKSEGLLASFEYNTDLFEAATVERMVGHLQTLLEGIVANPDTPIAQLPLLTAPERHQLLAEWNDTARDYPQDKCLHHLFEAQVAQSPEAIAVVFEAQQLTYLELNARANQVAHYLRRQGVGPEVLVGICVERSLEMIVGLLGILKAGGAYVPLDPTYPPERLQFMLQDAQIKVLLTQQKLMSTLPEYQGKQVCLDDLPLAQVTNPGIACLPTNLAYVLYTSGSTGRPKGVAVEHRSAVALLSWSGTMFSQEKQTDILASTTISFDLSVFEIFLPLVNGGKVILAENALALPDLDQVVLVNTVPSAMKELVNNRGYSCFSTRSKFGGRTTHP